MIKVCPIPENDWWRNREKKELTIIPITKEWSLKDDTIKEDYLIVKQGNIPWCWFCLSDQPEIRLFLNEATGIIAYETREEDGGILEFILSLPDEDVVRFEVDSSPLWTLEKVGDEMLCNRSQKVLDPKTSLVYCWSEFKEMKGMMKGREEFLGDEGTYKYTYLPTGYSLYFDVYIKVEYSLEVILGFKEKSNPKTPFHLLNKISSLLLTLTLPIKREWIKQQKLLSKKPSQK